ncbi:MAG: B12-binding domain-containing radical SAM protein, partial [Firmicutes bacterium]|nr:B12-binding domain-containing radical SAM protein [Bacillota bacterium]
MILGGCGFSVLPEATLPCCGADYGIVGDGEAVLPELVRQLRAGESVADLPGLVHRRGGRVVV